MLLTTIMKVYKKDFKVLFFDLCPESLDDLWALSLVIVPGDFVGMTSTRRFRVEGSDSSEKKQVFVELLVERVKLDLGLKLLKVLGVIKSGRPEEYVNIGEHHSFDLGLDCRFTLRKESLLDVQKQLLLKSIDAKRHKIFLVVLDDDFATIARVDNTNYSVIAEIKSRTSGKRETSLRKTSREDYFTSILQILQNEGFDLVVVGGPGFEKEYFEKFIDEKVTDKETRKKFVFVQANSVGASGIKDIIKGGILAKVISGFALERDIELIDEFMLALAKDRPITYGFQQVKDAFATNSLKQIILTDNFLRENFETAKQFLFSLEHKRIEYHILSSVGEAGKTLDSFGGIGAFLYY